MSQKSIIKSKKQGHRIYGPMPYWEVLFAYT